MKKEEWREIKDYPNYMISNMGRVKSLKYGKERILKQGKDNYGYYCVVLYEEQKGKTCKVHRLVAQAFIPNPQNLPCVNHKDENPSNNCIENLEWCTQEYNINYGTRNEKASKALSIAMKGKIFSQEHKNNISKAKQKPILQFNREGTKIIGKYNSPKQAGKELNINRSHIGECCRGELKTCGGYRWMYLEDYINRMNKLYQLTLKKVS